MEKIIKKHQRGFLMLVLDELPREILETVLWEFLVQNVGKLLRQLQEELLHQTTG